MTWLFLAGLGFLVVVMFVLFLAALLKMFYNKVEQGKALIINKTGKEPEVTFTGGMVWPVIHKKEVMDISVKAMEIDRRGKEGLICKDNIRADITVTFYVRVNGTEQDVLRVAKSVGCGRASKIETLKELFSAKFSEALKTVGKQMDFTDLFTERDTFKDRIIQVIGEYLNGYSLEDVAIDYLEQTPLESLEANNILDAQGIRKITDLTSKEAISTNDFVRTREETIKQRDVEAREKILELERQQEEAEARQDREVETIRAREQAETQKVQSEQQLISEKARIATEEQVQVADENKNRQVIVARKNKERTEAIENERVQRDQQLEATERERLVAVKQIEKEKDVEVEKKAIQEVIRERVNVERTVAEEEEKIKDTREIAGAERERKCQVIVAEREAEEKLIETTKAAQAKQQAAKHLADEVQTMAEAERIEAEKKAEAKKLLAAGIIEEQAANGLAEVKVKEARAHAIELEGKAQAVADTEKHKAEAYGIQAKGDAEAKTMDAKFQAEAKGTDAKGTAEAKVMREKYGAEAEGVEAKANAMKKLDAVGREHEEFKLQLNKAERIELAAIDVNRKIAEYQAQVMGEAMKSANIDVVGGDGEFLERFFKSISVAKATDGFMDKSKFMQSLTDGGNAKELVKQIRSLIGDSGIDTNDIKNLSVAALLTRIAKTGKTEEVKNEAGELKEKLNKSGLSSMSLSDVLGDWFAK